MIDLHAHILPGIDDGSRNISESLKMLAASASQGISRIAATPHFYPAENNITDFLARRADAVAALKASWQPGLPKLLLGAEVYYFDGMCHVQELDMLRIEGTPFLLVEMPFISWSERMVHEIEALHLRPGNLVVLAHIERYLPYRRNAVWLSVLRGVGVLMQCNAAFFLSWRTRRKAMRMLKRGEINFLGSDCHNMDNRTPELGDALTVIGEEGRQIIAKNISRLLSGWEADVT